MSAFSADIFLLPPPSRAHWLCQATQRLNAAGVDAPRLSAELILRHVLCVERVSLVAYPECPVPADALPLLQCLLARRCAGEPAAYILGEREFFGRDFEVNKATLIPRPETEHLIEAAIDTLAGVSKTLLFADLGTGSGCIAVTLCCECPSWQGLAVDLSAPALATAQRNARRHNVSARLGFVHADFTQPLLASASLDLVVSNPPYISLDEYRNLSPEVRDFEPATALMPGPGGLEHLTCLVHQAAMALKPGGVLLMEHGFAQGPAMSLLLESHTWANAAICKDLSEHDRFIKAIRAVS